MKQRERTETMRAARHFLRALEASGLSTVTHRIEAVLEAEDDCEVLSVAEEIVKRRGWPASAPSYEPIYCGWVGTEPQRSVEFVAFDAFGQTLLRRAYDVARAPLPGAAAAA